jgi:hypothetical protein
LYLSLLNEKENDNIQRVLQPDSVRIWWRRYYRILFFR